MANVKPTRYKKQTLTHFLFSLSEQEIQVDSSKLKTIYQLTPIYMFRTTFDEYKRDYFVGIERNLSLMKRFYGTDWIMRLYYHMSKNSTNWQRLCTLVCQDSNIDICDVENNPKFGNISNVFPLNWRFLPSVDDQVDLLLVRDLDSDLSKR